MTPSTLGDVEVLEQLDFQPEIPCHIAPDARSMWCATTADHSAEFAVLTDCGHVYYYCAGGAKVWDGRAECACLRMAEAVSIFPLC
jgi:hypothetical protein